ncbi:MAG: DUF1295 domain-containing protein [Flavobacteriales bacterium]|nr:DUF1295 domain-containing protein [Flavobacteriales bacterium]
MIYVWIMAIAAGLTPRTVLVASLVTAWGVRLTFNFARRGGYSWPPWAGEEDYRWAIVRKEPMFASRWAWSAFNLFFISLYQMGLVLLFTLPMLMCIEGPGSIIGWDLVLAALFLIALVIETMADQQQWEYQQEKIRLKASSGTLPDRFAKGFVHHGLWGIVRHPNYTAEQAQWILFFGFSIVATGRWINWSLTGAILLILLFRGSVDLGEKISTGKYPDYAEHKRKVPCFIPGIK